MKAVTISQEKLPIVESYIPHVKKAINTMWNKMRNRRSGMVNGQFDRDTFVSMVFEDYTMIIDQIDFNKDKNQIERFICQKLHYMMLDRIRTTFYYRNYKESIKKTVTRPREQEVPVSQMAGLERDSSLFVLNSSRTSVRTNNRANTAWNIDDHTDMWDWSGDAAQLNDQVDSFEILIRKANTEDRELLRMYFQRGMYMWEIAELLGVCESRVSQRMTRLLKQLEQRWENKEQALEAIY